MLTALLDSGYGLSGYGQVLIQSADAAWANAKRVAAASESRIRVNRMSIPPEDLSGVWRVKHGK
jgi:hypothetical protein